jgi:hypothetical protein
LRTVHKPLRACQVRLSLSLCVDRPRPYRIRRAPYAPQHAGPGDGVNYADRLVVVVARALGMDGAVGTAGLSRLAAPMEPWIVQVMTRWPAAL